MPLNSPLRVLHLEDDQDYAWLVRSLLEQERIAVEMVVVSSREDFEAALRTRRFDLVLADYLLPGYDGLEALLFAQENCPETPFLLISGTIGEQAAIASLQAGARDYVLKHWPDRLVPAIRRALAECEERAQRHRAESELIRQEKYFRTLTENSLDILTVLNRDAQFLYNSPSMVRILGYDPAELAGTSAFSLVHPEDLERVQQAFMAGLAAPEITVRIEFRCRHKEGTWRHLEVVGQNRLEDPEMRAVVINGRDISDRKETEEELRESEQQYRLIFDSHPNAMWIFDHESLAFLEVNEAAVRQYGYSREELLGMKLPDLRAEDEPPAMLEYYHRLVAESPHTGYGGDLRHRTKDGAVIDVEIKCNPICFRGRQASLARATDVTERRRIEHRDAALSKLGQSLSSASSAADAAQIIRSVADDLFAWDAFTLDLYSAEDDKVYPIVNVDTDLAGDRYVIPSDLQGKLPSGIARRVMAEGPELNLRQEPLQFPPDSVPIGLEKRPSASLMYVPIRNRTEVIGVLSVQSYSLRAYDRQDLNTLQALADHCAGALERIRAEQAFHESEKRFRDLFEGSPDAIFVEDSAGVVLDVNPAACQLHGFTREELVGRHFAELVPPSAREEALRNYPALMDGTVRQLEGSSLTREGLALPIELRANRIEYDGKPALLLHVRDISAHRRLEEQLRQAQKMEAIGQLAGGVAHDFNNILTVIHGHGSLLMSSGTLSPSAARSAQQVVQAADRAAALTRQLLAFGRRQIMQPKRLDMNEVVAHMTKMLGRILGEDIALQLQYHKYPAFVHADPGMMEQVLLNLSVNSRDAMPRGGLLRIEIATADFRPGHYSQHPEARPGKHVCLRVGDTGCGIAPENLTRIFEPFFTTKEMGKGTGLGLATVYGIVRQHQGWIEVESERERGTTFRVFLPWDGDPDQMVDNPPTEELARGGSETILVVEDEEPVRELVCDLLANQGYRILQAPSGLKALEVWERDKGQVNLLLTDLVMPDHLNGRELAERLWQEQPDLKVLFISGYSADVVGRDFVLNPGVNYLQKPFQPQTLVRTVRDCLDSVMA